MRLFSSLGRRWVALAVATVTCGAAAPAFAQTPTHVVWWQSFTTPVSPFQQLITDIEFTHYETPSTLFEIFAFNGTYLTGSSVWQASLQNSAFTDTVRLNPNIILAPGTQYALSMAMGGGTMARHQFDILPNGAFTIKTGPTTSFQAYGDADIDGFHIEYQQVVPVTPSPEPASIILVGTGLIGALGFARTRRDRTQS